MGSRAEPSNPFVLLPQPVHSPSLSGLCGVGPITSPGPLLSPGSSSDSNGGDAEGPGPPAPVSIPPPLHPPGLHSPGALRTIMARPRGAQPHLSAFSFWSCSHHGLPTCSLVPLAALCPGLDVGWTLPMLACSVAQVTFQQICKDVHLVKHQGQQLFIESRARPMPRPRLPGELFGVWVRSETWRFPDFHPNPEELVSVFCPWPSYRHVQGQDPFWSVPGPRTGDGPCSRPSPTHLDP